MEHKATGPSPATGFEEVEVLRPKELDTHPGDAIIGWAAAQLEIARSILDNPGGGLLFATQTMGQVRSGLHERDAVRWESVVGTLERAEDAAVHREFANCRRLIDQVLDGLRS
ncbi:MAG TPA: hypothetical protein VLU92_02205 [Candidatus Dormibacteraeota bacterium]|nr:hypothetical protein [Candidatus Dormibacteraeota bacterium]